MIALLLTVIVFPLTGAAVAGLLRLPLPASRLTSGAFLFLLGLGAHGMLLYGLGLLRVPLGPVAFVSIPLVSLAIALVGRKRIVRAQPVLHIKSAGRSWQSAEAPSFPREGREGLPVASCQLPTLCAKRAQPIPAEDSRLAAILFAVPLLALFAASAVMPTRDYDGRVTWLPKARAIALEESITGPFFHGERGLNLHNRYPLLLPLDVATVMRLGNDTRNEAARWIYVLIPMATFIVLRAKLRAWFGTTGAWVAVVPAWLPILSAVEGGALAAYHDLALAAFVGMAVLYLLEAQHDVRALRVAALFAAFAVATKNEGSAAALALIAAAAFVRGWTLLIPVGVAEAVVVTWRTLVPAAYDEQYEGLIASLPRSAGRLPAAAAALVRHALDFHEWGFYWMAVAAAIAVCLWLRRSRDFAIPFVTMALLFGAYVAALTVTSWRIEDLAPVAANRLLGHLIVPASCILALAAQALTVHRNPPQKRQLK